VTETFEGDVGVILGRLRRAGFDSAIIVDLTRNDIQIPVVRVLVPHCVQVRAANDIAARKARSA
jgi:ribosomal protein S12 methylthiotransferase accessory factor YcaO